MLTLENNWQDCTYPVGQTKDAAWYLGGYARNYGYPNDFLDYTTRIVSRYKNGP